MPKNIFIVRHGETDYNKLRMLQGRGIDAPLNELGTQQAKALAAYFKDHPLDAIFSSTMRRALSTAEYIARHHNGKISAFEDLEEMDYGTYEGIEYTEVAEELDAIKNSWMNGKTDLVITGGESPEMVLNRAKRRIVSLLESSVKADQTVVFVVHGRLIRILLSHWLKGSLKHMHTIGTHNCSINHLTWQNNRIQPVVLNETGHLSHLIREV